MTRAREQMVLQLTEQEIGGSWAARPITLADTAALGTLMYEANVGTIDYEGETRAEALTEIQGTFDGKYGPLLDQCSYVMPQGDRLVSACIVTLFANRPLVTFLMTHPDVRGQGMGAHVLKQSINALLRAGYDHVRLFVTVGNAPAQHLYTKLGFQVVDSYGGTA